MSNQNRFLLPHQHTAAAGSSSSHGPSAGRISPDSAAAIAAALGQENEYQVDTDFDSYWEEEARNPHRNRIRIGRQYQATVPSLLKQGERDQRKLEHLETLSFCPKRSAKVTNGELDNYFAVAKSLNLFASLVETRSLLGRDVTIADLNRIRHREGLSLASVIQPPNRQQQQQQQQTNVSPQSSQQLNNPTASGSPQKSPSSHIDNATSSATSPIEPAATTPQESQAPLNKPLMKALSHFISLHHPCYHNDDCKKLQKDIPLEDDSVPAVNLRATSASASSSSSKDFKSSRSRSKQQVAKADEADNTTTPEHEQPHGSGDTSTNVQSQSTTSYDDWTREDVELLSKAIEVCGKKFGSIKKEFLPSKSVRSIVEYYYVGSRDVSDSRKRSSLAVDTTDGCSSPEKLQANNNGQGGCGGGSGNNTDNSLPSSKTAPNQSLPDQQHRSNTSDGNGSGDSTSSSSSNNNNNNSQNNKTNLSEAGDTTERTPAQNNNPTITNRSGSKKSKSSSFGTSNSNSKAKSNSKTIDARMSVYNFDDEMKEDTSNINVSPPPRFDGLRAGAEVKPLKAKPILPNAPSEGEAGNSNVGSLKFFMDGQLVLKLNACQEQQEGGDKCHWVQSGDKLPTPSRHKRYSKRSSSDQQRQSSDPSQNGSQSNSVISSHHEEDSTRTNDDLSDGEDSKESAHSFAPRQKSFSASPTPKRIRQNVKTESSSNCVSPIQTQPPILPIDYNRLAVNNRMKENAANLNSGLSPQPQLVDQAAAAAAAMPWLQANSFAMAAALLQGIPFPGAASGFMNAQLQNNLSVPNNSSMISNNIISNNIISNNNNNSNVVNSASSKPMDLSIEHQAPKPIQTTAKSRSRSKQKNN